ncbi:MAG TPA: SH3 domain-containing protein [Candidatus Limnocylindrales bacterium]|nr:SH3 domain-containing protein [Candidatus Limnocylindrales bacterium]
MTRNSMPITLRFFVAAILLTTIACKGKDKVADIRSLPDLSQQARPYVTIENTKVRTGPGPQFRVIADVPRDAQLTAVGRDGEWVLIVSKKGNAPGFVPMASVRAADGSARNLARAETKNPSKYQTVADTPLRSGPGLQYPVVTDLTKGTLINVVDQENGWLRVESKQEGRKPGYIDASYARPTEMQ